MATSICSQRIYFRNILTPLHNCVRAKLFATVVNRLSLWVYIFYLPLRRTFSFVLPSEFLATHKKYPQALSVIFVSVYTATKIPKAKTLPSLLHVTLNESKLLAVQLRLTFCPILTGGGRVTKVILGGSAIVRNQIN